MRRAPSGERHPPRTARCAPSPRRATPARQQRSRFVGSTRRAPGFVVERQEPRHDGEPAAHHGVADAEQVDPPQRESSRTSRNASARALVADHNGRVIRLVRSDHCAEHGQHCCDGASPPPFQGVAATHVAQRVQHEQGSEAPEDHRQRRQRDWAAANDGNRCKHDPDRTEKQQRRDRATEAIRHRQRAVTRGRPSAVRCCAPRRTNGQPDLEGSGQRQKRNCERAYHLDVHIRIVSRHRRSPERSAQSHRLPNSDV